MLSEVDLTVIENGNQLLVEHNQPLHWVTEAPAFGWHRKNDSMCVFTETHERGQSKVYSYTLIKKLYSFI